MRLWNETSELLTVIHITIWLHMTRAQETQEGQVLACPFRGGKASGHLRSNPVDRLHLWLPQGWTQPSADAKSGFFSPETEGTVAPDSSMETGFFSGVDYPELPHLSPLSSCVLHPGHSANLHRTQPEGPLQAPFSALLLKLAQLPNQYGLLWVSFPLIF